jgi:hypothetical protein
VAVPHLRSATRLVALALAAGLAGCLSKDATAPTALTLPTPLWTVTTGAGVGRIFVESNGALLVGTADSMIARNGATGGFLWGRAYGTLPIGGFAFDAGNARAIFVGSSTQTIDATTGLTLYTDPLAGVSTPPSSDGTNLYVARTAPSIRIDQVSPAGVAGWSTPLATVCPTGCTFGGTAVSGDTVYLAGSQTATGGLTQSLVMAFSRTTGTELWRKLDNTVDTAVSAPPVVIGKQLVLTGVGGRLLWALDRSTRVRTWTHDETGTPLTLRPVIAGNLLLVASAFIGEAVVADSGYTSWSVSSNTPLVKMAACPNSVAWAAIDAMIVVNRTTGALLGGREGITLSNALGDIAASNGRFYIATASGPTLAAYTCL